MIDDDDDDFSIPNSAPFEVIILNSERYLYILPYQIKISFIQAYFEEILRVQFQATTIKQISQLIKKKKKKNTEVNFSLIKEVWR